METFTINTPFPAPNPAPGMDYARMRTMQGGSFDLLMYMAKPSPAEIEAAKTGPVIYGLFTQAFVPFFIVKFETFSFDAPLNILKVDNDEEYTWIKSDANAVNLFLVEATTNIIVSMRCIGIDMELVHNLKSTCAKQLGTYRYPVEVDNAAAALMQRYTTDEMLRETKIYKL